VRVLIVEDEQRMADLLRRGLTAEAIDVDVAATGEDALRHTGQTAYDVILLDVMLPGIDGFETCRRIRKAGLGVPVLMLTARESVDDRVAGLDSGADDYMLKPFAFAELLARLRALQRRAGPGRDAVLQVDDLRLDPVSRRVERDGTEIALSPTEYAVLEALMRRPEEVVSRDALVTSVWGQEREPRSNIVDVYIGHLRHKIDEPFGRRSLETVRGAGYRLRMGGSR
jgi:two-component system OmpR family response regulator